jgi:N-methylhydantoinase A
LLASGLRYDIVQSALRPLTEVDPAELEEGYRRREETLRARLHADGCDDGQIDVTWAADLRYRGQSYELAVPVEERRFDATIVRRLRDTFDAAHRAEFGHEFPEYDVELVNIRLTGIGRLFELDHAPVTGATRAEALTAEAEVAFRVDGSIDRLPTAVYDRELLPVGEEIPGPAIVTQLDSTMLVPPGSVFARDAVGNLRIRLSPA